MYEKNMFDWNISKATNFKKNGFNIYIGTYSNDYLSIVDCLALLELGDKTKEKEFLEYLNKENIKNEWFNKTNKQEHIDFIKEYGINPYCFFNMDNFIMNESEFLYSNGDITDNQYIDENKIKSFIDSGDYHKEFIGAIYDSKDIKDLYLMVLIIKENIKTNISCDIFNFISTSE